MHIFWALFAAVVILANMFYSVTDEAVVRLLLLCIINELFCIVYEIKKRGK